MSETILRDKIADYLDVSETATPEYAFCSVGFNTLDESPGAQTDSKTYIHEKDASTTIKGYQSTFPFDTDLIIDEEAVLKLYEIGRNRKTGADARLNYVRVELFDPVAEQTTVFAARKFIVSVEVADLAKGNGGEIVHVAGNFHTYGTFVDGTFDTSTKTFTAA